MADPAEPTVSGAPVPSSPAGASVPLTRESGPPVAPLHLVEVGWKEWIGLPELGITRVVAKVDTGAKTSALHAFYVEPFKWDDEAWVRFGLHPLRKSSRRVTHCSARVIDYRKVRDSGGHEEFRYVIETAVVIGGEQFLTEMTLTKRDSMRYRFLLGRSAIRGRYVVNAAKRYCLGKPVAK